MKIHTYAKCDTCRKAVKWLKARNLAITEVPIRERPPSKADLGRMLAIYKGDLKRLFNTSGGDYRELSLKDKLPTMSTREAIDLLSGNGNLVKRPFVIGDGVVLVGFKESEWEAALLNRH
jgi:arsenate reductase